MMTSNSTEPLALSFSVIVTYITLPGTLILGSAPAGGVIPITVTPVMLTAKVSSASGISSYIKNKFDTKLIF